MSRDSKQNASQIQLQVLKEHQELSVRCDAVEVLIWKAKQSREKNAEGAVGSSLSGGRCSSSLRRLTVTFWRSSRYA